MFKVKVLFCKFGAINEETQETTEAIFQHFNKTFGFKDPKNCKMLESINNFRKEKFGDLQFSLVGDANDPIRNNSEVAKHFNGREVLEVVFSSDGTFFERACWKNFDESKWIRDNMNPIQVKEHTWKKPTKVRLKIMDPTEYVAHVSITESLNKAFDNTSLGKLGQLVNKEELFQKIASTK